MTRSIPESHDIAVTEGFGTVAVSWNDAGQRLAFIVNRRTGAVVRARTGQPASTEDGRLLVRALRRIDEIALARFVWRRFR
jgi:hypothetical protein